MFLMPKWKGRAVLALPRSELSVPSEGGCCGVGNKASNGTKKKIHRVRAAFLFCRSFHTLKKLRQEVKEIVK